MTVHITLTSALMVLGCIALAAWAIKCLYYLILWVWIMTRWGK